MEQELKDKHALFAELYNLDDESTESEEEDEIKFVLHGNRRRASSSIQHGRLLLDSPPRQRPNRTASSPIPQLGTVLDEHASILEKAIPTLPRAVTFSGSTATYSVAGPSEVICRPASKVTGKRKRTELPNYQPATQQIFKGQSFCECCVVVI